VNSIFFDERAFEDPTIDERDVTHRRLLQHQSYFGLGRGLTGRHTPAARLTGRTLSRLDWSRASDNQCHQYQGIDDTNVQ